MKRILAAIGGTATGRHVLDEARKLAPLLGAVVEAVHVRDDGAADVSSLCSDAKIPLTVAEGPVEPTLGDLADAPDVVALVVGARDIPTASSPSGHVTLDAVVTIAKPVLVVPPDAPGRDRLRTVLVPLDGTAQTAATVADAIALIHSFGAEIQIVHVHDEACMPLFEDQPQHESTAWADEFRRRYCGAGPRFSVAIRFGIPVDQILTVSEETGADLILLAWKRDLSGGHAAVVRGLLERSRVPVLLYPSVLSSEHREV